MSKWRERGIVQDSDNDDDDEGAISDCQSSALEEAKLEQQGVREPANSKFEHVLTTESASSESKHLLSPVVVLGKTSPDDDHSRNLRQPPDILTNANANTHSISSVTSSPLSEVPDNLNLTQPQSTSQWLDLCEVSVPQNNTTTELNLATDEARLQENGRSFRERNPIQLHPYLLENELYRQTLRGRGLRPVAITNNEQNRASYSLDESQNLFHPSADSDPRENGVEGLLASSESSDQSHIEQSDSGSIEEELPSLADLLRSTSYVDENRSQKRRKLSRSNPSNATDIADHSNAIYTLSPVTPSILQINSPEIDTPNSLPPSNASLRHVKPSTKRQRLKRFRMPKEDRIDSLPTPLPSSDSGKLSRHPVLVESDSEADSDINREAATAPPDQLRSGFDSKVQSPSLPLESPSSSESDGIQRVSKRIKGVLPASWLRLDQQKQARPKSTTRRHHVPPTLKVPLNGEAPKGVAKRIHFQRPTKLYSESGKSAQLSLAEVLDETDTENSSVSHSGRHSPLTAKPMYTNPAREDEHTQEVEEEDWIDLMLPAIPRSKPKSSHRKRQLRVNEFLPRAKSYETANGVAEHSSFKAPKSSILLPRESKQRKRQARRRSVSHLSILDAVESVPRSFIPDFVRVAVRQANSRSDKGRHSPSKKLLSSHNLEDTTYMQNSLKNWEKRLNDTWKHATTSNETPTDRRLPLSVTSQNLQARLPTVLNSTSASNENLDTISTYNDATTKPKRRQTTLNDTIEHLPAEAIRAADQSKPPQSVPKSPTKTGFKPNAEFQRPGHLEDIQGLSHYLSNQHSRRRNRAVPNTSLNKSHTSLQGNPNPLLERYLDENSENLMSRPTKYFGSADSTINANSKLSNLRQARKRRPRPLFDGQRGVVRLRSPEIFLDEAHSSPVESKTEESAVHLRELGPFGTVYTTDFDVRTLPVGVYFHSNTFLGSGDLLKALKVSKRNLDQNAPSASFASNGKQLSLGPWTQEASEKLREIYTTISRYFPLDKDSSLEEDAVILTELAKSFTTVSSTLRSIVDYLANSLSFLDSIDRRSFLSETSEELARLLCRIKEYNPASENLAIASAKRHLKLRALTILMVAIYLVSEVANHPTVFLEMKEACESAMRESCHVLADSIVEYTFSGSNRAAEQMQNPSIRETGFKDDAVEPESIVVLHNVLTHMSRQGFGFWDVVNHSFDYYKIDSISSVKSFEAIWSTIFSILPLQEVDATGILRPNQRYSQTQENWNIVRRLLERLFSLYSRSVLHHSASLNSYLRANISRCFVLVNQWGWHRCESILSVIFDFFAMRDLASLRNEDGRTCSSFLQELEHGFTLSIQPGDRSYDIFLKLLATGLYKMQRVYPDKKIKNIAWRFLPNHGRVHAKEHELKEYDLYALRNHHNLLCVLYWASPSGSRINVDLIKSLVDFSTSHSELCRLNARTWSNLMRFQLSTEEDGSTLDPFVGWFQLMLRKSLNQHQQARAEAEAIFHSKENESMLLTRDMLESTIANNEKQVEDTLTLLLDSLASLLKNASNTELGRKLFENSQIQHVLHAFSPKKSRFTNVVCVALDSYQHCFDLMRKAREQRLANKTARGEINDDSQDYGEWLALDDLDESGSKQPGEGLYDSLTYTLQTLLSNAFGAESFYDEEFLTKLVETWVSQCSMQVMYSSKDWTYYLDSQSSGSWHRLRDTEQTRKFAPYFIARILKSDPEAFMEHSWPILSIWLVSLVERESMLKHQHLLTDVLLTVGSNHSLLQNLPFSVEKISGQFNIRLNDIRDRRLGLLSSVFSNIRHAVDSSSAFASETRASCAILLKDLMTAMKRNYQETQQHNTTSGVYVQFVQKVVEFLQQYTTDVCAIDKFFTDPSTFPLPAKDPTYIVGRLKSYSPKLFDLRTQKKLVVFLRAVCERATMDGQQEYLVDQLVNCQSGFDESLDQEQHFLRRFLVQAILPRYVETITYNSCGWILGAPALEALRRVYDDLLFNFQATDALASGEVFQMSTVISRSLRQVCSSMLDQGVNLLKPETHLVFSSILCCASSILHVIDYLHRLWRNGLDAIQEMLVLNQVAISLENTIDGEFSNLQITELYSSLSERVKSRPAEDHNRQSHDIESYCAEDLKQTLSRNWSYDNGSYYVQSSGSKKEVAVRFQCLEQEKDTLLETIDKFKTTIARMPSFCGLVE